MRVKRLAQAARQRFARDLDRLPLAWRVAALAAVASLMTSTMIAATWHLNVDAFDQSRMDRFGAAVSAQLAAGAVEPLIAGDRIRLGVLAQRMTRLPEVSAVSIYTIDDRVVAMAGDPRQRPQAHYAHPIEFEDTLAGFVRTGIDPAAFRPHSASARLWLPALVMLLASAGLGYALGRQIEGRAHGPTAGTARSDARSYDAAGDDAGSETPPGAGDADDGRSYLLVINLFNQASLPADVRSEALAQASRRASQVAARYRGHVLAMPGTGALVVFPPQPEPDFCFRVVCAALLCVDMLEELSDGIFRELPARLVFRFGLHAAAAGAPQAPAVGAAGVAAWRDTDAAADAVLLSAVAGNGAVALSRDAFACLDEPDRCQWVWRDNPVLNTLVTAEGGSCALIDGVADEYRSMLDHEVELLLAQSTASPSTF